MGRAVLVVCPAVPSGMRTDGPMIEWIWRQMGVQLPPDWECLQFSRDPEMGRCAFADRRRFRFELNWRRCAGEPDFGRMMKDYASSLEREWTGIRAVKCQAWPGLTGTRGHEAVSRFGRYFGEIGVVAEVVFVHPDRRAARLEAEILPTVRAVPPEPTGMQLWRAFGMEIRVPKEFALGECVAEPARVGMRFDGPQKTDRWIFRRYGMVDSWLTVPVREWLAAQAGELVRNVRPRPGGGGAAGVERIEGEWRPRGVLSARGAYAAAAWRDRGDGRLYHAICITGKKQRRFHPERGADHVLKSCPEFLAVPERAAPP